MLRRVVLLSIAALILSASFAAGADTIGDFEVVRGGGPETFLCYAGKRYLITGNDMLKTLGHYPETVKSVPQSQVDMLSRAGQVKDVNLPIRMVRGTSEAIFLVLDRKRIYISDYHTFRILGFEGTPVERLQDAQIRAIPVAGDTSGTALQIGTAPPAKPDVFMADGVIRSISSSAARVFVECLMENRRKAGGASAAAYGKRATPVVRGPSTPRGTFDGDARESP